MKFNRYLKSKQLRIYLSEYQPKNQKTLAMKVLHRCGINWKNASYSIIGELFGGGESTLKDKKNKKYLDSLPSLEEIKELIDPQEWNKDKISLEDSERLSAFYKSIFYVGKGTGKRLQSYKSLTLPKSTILEKERRSIAYCQSLRESGVGYYPFLAFSPSKSSNAVTFPIPSKSVLLV